MGGIVFVGSFSKTYCRKLAAPQLNIPVYITGFRVQKNIFMALYFYSYLTATQIITFGYIEWNPDVVLNGSFF